MSPQVVLLTGGTGGAKLARGMLEVLDADQLTVIANTGDDIEIYGGYVSPDPDLVTFWLADLIDARGWGLKDDTFHVMDALRGLGHDVWFNLGDRDLALGIQRAAALDRGLRLTEAHGTIVKALGVRADVLPMSDLPVRTRVLARGQWWPFQEFMIRGHGRGPVDDIELRGAPAAAPTPEVLEAIDRAEAIVIGPSNPFVSIEPILAIPGMCDALRRASAPVIAVSPLVHGSVLKGPTDVFMQWAGLPLSSDGIVSRYVGLIDGIVADERASKLPTLETSVLMDDPAARRRVAEQTLTFAISLV